MFTISGKQKFGAVWHDGRCIARFTKGVAHVDSLEDADYLKTLGYTVEGQQMPQEPPASEPDETTPPNDDPTPDGAQSEQDGASTDPEADPVPAMGVNPRRGRNKK